MKAVYIYDNNSMNSPQNEKVYGENSYRISKHTIHYANKTSKFILRCVNLLHNVLMTNEMHNSYNQFLFHSFLSALHVSNESSRSSSEAQYNTLYYTVQSVQSCYQASLASIKLQVGLHCVSLPFIFIFIYLSVRFFCCTFYCTGSLRCSYTVFLCFCIYGFLLLDSSQTCLIARLYRLYRLYCVIQYIMPCS